MNAEAEHIPHRPTWHCLCCGKPWPCDPARESLSQEGDAFTRNIYLSVQLDVAFQDMPTTPVRELYERFLAWTWPVGQDAGPGQGTA